MVATPSSLAGGDDPGHVLGRLGQEVQEVGAEAGLGDADHQQVRELGGQDPVQGVGAVGPALGQAEAAPTPGVEAQTGRQLGGHLVAGGEHQHVDRVLLAVGDHAGRR